MSSVLVVVADGSVARFFEVVADDALKAGARLVEGASILQPDLKTLGKSVTGRARTETNTNREAGPVHPIGAQRERHRLEHERQFAREIAQRALVVTKPWKAGELVLVAEPKLLGLLRDPMRKALPAGIELKELARDYVHLDPAELRERLALDRLIPAR